MSGSSGRDMVRRCGVGGTLLGGLVGGVVGLMVGLHAYARTAAFAVVEVGLPCALLAGLLGVLVGLAFAALAADGGGDRPRGRR